MSNRRSYWKAAILVFPLLLIAALYRIERWLLNIGFLNKKDLGFVGDESGSFYEYATNIWYWDAALFVLTIVAVIFSIVMIIKFVREKKSDQPQNS